MAFKKGQSGNPSGRPPISPAVKRALNIFDKFAPEGAQILVDLARKGNLDALKICISKVIPDLKSVEHKGEGGGPITLQVLDYKAA